MNDAKLFPRKRMFDLSHLNEAERRVLRMLAEGHTAKSIANAIGSTPTAVNERLREARRKTGIGSSRELARMLKAQENRHEQMGVARPPGSGSAGALEAAARRRNLGVLAMVGLLLAAGAAALMTQQPNPHANDVDPLLGAALPKFTDPADWHAKVRTERRDPEWAPLAEEQIRGRVLQIPLIGKNGNVLRVTCATTLCEIAGTMLVPASKREREDPRSAFNRAIRDLQVPPLPDDLAKFGLKSEGGTFTGAKGRPDRTAFLVYYSRAKP